MVPESDRARSLPRPQVAGGGPEVGMRLKAEPTGVLDCAEDEVLGQTASTGTGCVRARTPVARR